MNPIIYNPAWTKEQLWSVGLDYIYAAARMWSVPRPIITSSRPVQGRTFMTGGTFYGEWTRPDRIFVNVARSTTPVKVRGRIWSYPGHKTDRTCLGILAHEFAHHLTAHVRMDVNRWRLILKASKPVTSYEPTPDEAWAESGRIFILNPDLLRRARPERYQYITQYFAPLHNLSWQRILINAPDFIRASAEKFAGEGQLKCE